MTVVCIEYQLCDEAILLLPTEETTSVGDDNFVLMMGFTVDQRITEYRVTKGREYTVYGILSYKGQVRFLIQDDAAMPVYCPGELFRIRTSGVYWDWGVASFSVGNIPLLLVGYPVMEGGYDELIDLVARKDEAFKQFLKYKDYAEKYKDLIV